jgi:hypothetical protein
MSLPSEEPTSPQDLLHYAPRRLRERPEQRLAAVAVEDSRTGLDNKRFESSIGRISRPVSLDAQLENAVHESLRRPIDPTVVGEPRVGLTPELERQSAMFGLAGRLAMAIGAAAVIALFLVFWMPASRQADSAASLSATVQSFTSALARQPQPQTQPQSEDAPKPALAEFQSLLKSTNAAQAPQNAQPAATAQPDQPPSDKALQQFLTWRQKGGDPSQ